MKKLYRSSKNKVISGVCGGLAEYFEVDPLIVRIIFVALSFSGMGLIIYLLLALLVPIGDNSKIKEEGEVTIEFNDQAKNAFQGLKSNNIGFILGAFLVVMGASFLLANFWPFNFLLANFWPISLILIGLIIIFKKK